MKNYTDLTGKNAIVTGAAQGLSLGMAEGLMEAGAKVCIIDVNPKAGKRCIAMPENSRGIHSEDHGYGSGDCNYADTGSADAATE